ncbi:Regulator of RNase E activity RraA [Paenibacillus algorifonticola]|uniref:Putative 4-hydroxy-4-methyl-2-oxoglutarate aldolase n=1 Tax=Paenibacillus algorifonticola TaxID=684063 RepID=A0A1I2A788_9BACL|nr:dimethylmenaquinone methyltransferase [Paenibacillus algorifonticola]SFE39647.1 Regulator of RNase E activity RraA [Paenibacillus algorifonticola]
MKFDNPEDIGQLTPLWEGERFENGRPKVDEDILRRMRKITLEEAWGPLWNRGYTFQFEGDFKIMHPEQVMVGRAVTAVMVPKRPDLHETLLDYGHEQENRHGFFNQWVIDSLVEDDVVVVDMFDKIHSGTYVGGNLSTAIATRTKRGGAVIWGGIRDNQQVKEIGGINVYYRGSDPTAIADVTMVGMNVPTRIGKAICMPGDVVLGTPAGVIFIPPHLAELTVVQAEKSQVRDVFGFIRLKQQVYSTAQIDAAWNTALWQDFIDWFNHDDAAAEYRHLSWDDELEDARKREHDGPRSDVRL